MTQAGRALGNIFIPALNAIIPYAIAAMNIIRELANTIANFFGFALPTIDYSGLENTATSAGDLAENIGSAAGGAKDLQKTLLGIDELNILSSKNAGGGGGSGATGDSGFDFELPEYDFIGTAVSEKVKEITESLKDLLPLIGAVGAGFAAWGVTKWLAGLFGVKDVLAALTVGDYLSIFAGLLMTVGGAILYMSGAMDAMKNGVDWTNLAKMITGVGIAATGLYLALKPFKLSASVIAGGITLLAGGFGMLAISVNDMKNGDVTIENVAGAIAGLVTATVGASIAFKNFSFALAPLIAPITMFAGSIALITGTMTSLIKDGPTTANLIGAIAGAVGLITSAVWLLTTALNKNPIFAIATLAVGIVTAITSITSALTDSGKKAYEASDDFRIMTDVIERCEEISTRSADALGRMNDAVSGLNDVSADFAVANQLVDEIFEINDNANASNYELELMRVKVETLNSLGLENFQLEIDETTGRIKQTRDSIQEVIKELENQAKMAALQDVLTEAYRNQYTATVDLEQATRDYRMVTAQVEETQRKLNETSWYEFEIRGQLKAQLEKQTEAQNAAKQAMDSANETLLTSNQLIEDSTDEIIKMRGQQWATSKEGQEAIGKQLAPAFEKIVGYASDITSGIKNFDFSSIGSKITSGIVNPFQKASNFVSSIFNMLLGMPKSVNFSSTSNNKPWDKNMIQLKASGGQVTTGQLFMAREAGPELVGTMGGRTTVANNDQIVEGIAQGVYKAVVAAMGESGSQDIYIDGEKVFSIVKERNNRERIRTGVNPLMV